MSINHERRSGAHTRILHRHLIRAEWLRLKGPPEQQTLKRGVWYRLVDFETRSDLVTLFVAGEERTLAYSLLKPRRDIPEKATVFSPSTLSTPKMGFDVMTYVAVCPKGHEVGEVSLQIRQRLTSIVCLPSGTHGAPGPLEHDPPQPPNLVDSLAGHRAS